MTMGQHTATHPSPPEIVIAITKSMTRWGALHPGRLRVESNKIVVSTRFGDHRPPAADEKTLQTIIESISALPPTDAAANLFVVLAKAQPFRGSKQAHCTSCRNSAGAARRPNFDSPVPRIRPRDTGHIQRAPRQRIHLWRGFTLRRLHDRTRCHVDIMIPKVTYHLPF